MLMRFDPLRDIDRFTEQMLVQPGRAPRSFPMDAVRRGDRFLVRFDLPGVEPDSIDLTVERNGLTVRAERRFDRQEGDEVLVHERPEGTYSRQLFLGDSLDTEHIAAGYVNGVLELTIPVAESAKPRRVQVSGGEQPQQIDTSTQGAAARAGAPA